MVNSYKNFLLKLLEAMNYRNPKEKFVADFERNIEGETFSKLNETLSEEKQKELAEALTHTQNDPEQATQVLSKYFTQEQIRQTFGEAAINETKGLLEAVKESLDDEQKQKIMDLITKTFSPTQIVHESNAI